MNKKKKRKNSDNKQTLSGYIENDRADFLLLFDAGPI